MVVACTYLNPTNTAGCLPRLVRPTTWRSRTHDVPEIPGQYDLVLDPNESGKSEPEEISKQLSELVVLLKKAYPPAKHLRSNVVETTASSPSACVTCTGAPLGRIHSALWRPLGFSFHEPSEIIFTGALTTSALLS